MDSTFPAGDDGHRPEQGLSVLAISKSFGNDMALNNVSLHIGYGEVVGLFGRDGAGKTICFQAIVGLTSIDEGRILLNGHDIADLTVDERGELGLSYLPQEPSVFSGMTTAENIHATLEMCEPDPVLQVERLDALLRDFNIAYVRDVPAMRLSGGERRRCEIARALAASPSIMLLDEPFSGIDPLSIVSLQKSIADLRQRDIGVLISDQNVHEMLEIIDRAYVLHEGRVIFEGDPANMLGDEQVRRFYLGADFTP